MSTRLSKYLISERIVLSNFQSINSLLREIAWRETTSNIHNVHLVTISSSNDHALSSSQNSSLEGRWSMMSRSTVEMNTWEIDSHISDFHHSVMHFFSSVKVISKLAWERRSQIVSCIFLDSQSPENLHFWCNLFNFSKFINWIGSCKFNLVIGGPLKIVFVFNWVWINKIWWFNSHIQKWL